MNIVYINAVPYGSTGRIMFSLADIMHEAGNEVVCTTGFSWTRCHRDDYVLTSNVFEKQIHTILSKYTGKIGFFSRRATRRLIKRLNEFKPDIIHLHNLHGWFVNLPMLFQYIKANDIKVVWTLHDCWSFTGHCPHFDMIGCDKWETQCYDCPQHRDYPQSFFDNSKFMYDCKKKWFMGVKNMMIITPSEWLEELVKRSFLKEYTTKVINNGIDLNVFKPTQNNFKRQYKCENKYLLLGVALGWNARKGVDVFIELAKRLSNEYQIVLVGTNEETDRELPDNIISIHSTAKQSELAGLYTAADLFVNPTREENYPTVNMEALACGTPVLTFKTGGSPETIGADCGSIVEKNNIDAMEREIIRICKEKPYSKEACLKKARSFDVNIRFNEYVDLYRGML